MTRDAASAAESWPRPPADVAFTRGVRIRAETERSRVTLAGMDAEPTADAPLLDAVYDQLRAIAKHRLANESPAHTLQPTALVHEAWLKLGGRESVMALDRPRFLMAAAEAMRRVLIDHARGRDRAKRGGGAKRSVVELADIATLAADADPDQIIALEDAMIALTARDRQAARVVQLRFFAGLSVEETAACLGLSDRTVKRDWQFARAWLFDKLK